MYIYISFLVWAGFKESIIYGEKFQEKKKLLDEKNENIEEVKKE